ncbi:hypothetical protein F4804DRAFT_202254 [Jackrogersella minutella]|nr:hypothetical protein F4804DRAFT_202254 [Jackrogersella minutella]
MRASRNTCLLCRHVVATSKSLRVSQWQPQATYYDATSSRRETSKNKDPERKIESRTDEQKPVSSRRVAFDPHKYARRLRWTMNNTKKTLTKDSSRVDALFKKIVQEQTESQDEPKEDNSTAVSMDLALVKSIAELERKLEKDAPAVDAYNYLKTVIYPILKKPNVTPPKVFRTIVSRLMEKVFAAKREAIRSPKLPTVAEIFRVYADIGDLKPRLWCRLVGELVQELVLMDPSMIDDKLITQDDMLADLVECWKVLSLPNPALAPSKDSITHGFWFPKRDDFLAKKFTRKRDFPAAFSSLFPHYPPNQLGSPPAILAIATYALLLDPQRTNEQVVRDATRFISRLANLINYVHFGPATLRGEIMDTFPKLNEYITNRWSSLKVPLQEKFESSPSTKGPWINVKDLELDLERAYATRNVRVVVGLWDKFVGSDETMHPARAASLQPHPELFDHFIHYYMALNEPDKAIFAYNAMRKADIKPTLRTWNGMLDGCKKAKNINGLKNVWLKLSASKMQLDTAIWTTRVSGLIESGDTKGGLQALKEMTRLWKEHLKGESMSATAVEPSIMPVNAALVGLVRQNEVAAAESLLAWAGNQGLEPDIFTYNTLLRRFIRDGRDEDVRRIFTAMENADVAADEATFTIVIDAAFSNIEPEDTEAQMKTVADVLDQMERAGLKVNTQNYGKIIYNLLQVGDNAKGSVKVVLAHLWSKGHEMSPHIYTMLIEHYFSRRPHADIDAVEALVQGRQLLDNKDMDYKFYDRLIRGYAQVGCPEKAVRILHKVTKTGVVTPMTTRVTVMNALLKKDLVGMARDFVADTKKLVEESHGATVDEAGVWGHPFWRLAWQHGILKLDEGDAKKINIRL